VPKGSHKVQNKIPNATLLEDLHRVVEARQDTKQITYMTHGRFSSYIFYTRFGPWRKVLKAAVAFKPNTLMARAAQCANASHESKFLVMLRHVEPDVRDTVPYKRYTDEEIEKLWPGRMYQR